MFLILKFLSQYLGTWFEIERYDQEFQMGADCVIADYSLNADDSVRVWNRGRILSERRDIEDTGRAVISFPEDPLGRAKLNVTFFPDRKNQKKVE